MPRNKTIGAVAVFAVVVSAAAVVQANGSGSSDGVIYSTGTATIVSGAGTIELSGAGNGVHVVRLSGALSRDNVLRSGDVITAIDDIAVGTPEDIFSHVRDRPGSNGFELTIDRSGDVFVRRVDQSLFQQIMTPRPPVPPPVR